MQKRVVTDIVYNPDGSRAVALPVLFSLDGGSFTPTEYVIEKSYSTVTNHLGEFSYELWCNEEGLEDTYWTCTLPDGEVVRFVLPIGPAPITLRELRESHTVSGRAKVYDAVTWQRLKDAAIEYSGYRPYLDYAVLAPAVGTTEVEAPPHTTGVDYCSYGDEFTLAEVRSVIEEGTAGWHFHNGTLYLTPTPADTTITVVWRRLHLPNELTQTFPTIPAKDMLYVRWLAEAEAVEEEQAAIEAGLSSYTIGATTVKWSGQGGGQPSRASRAQRLRQRALTALSGPLTEWG